MHELRPKRIGLHTQGAPFDGGTLETRALGGSETALIQAARVLADRGHQVSVFNNCDRPGMYDGVRYLPFRLFPKSLREGPYDVFIVSRYFGFFTLPFPARFKVLWNHDTLDRPRDLKAVIDEIDILFVLSGFHRDNYLARLPETSTRFFITKNGIDTDLIGHCRSRAAEDPNKVIYASRPERGLEILIEKIWPRLSKKYPKLTLHLCGYDVERDQLAPGLGDLYDRLDRLIDQQKNIVRLGSLPKAEYYRHLAEACLMLYPCSFPEISCIAALEAQAARTPVITTDGFALSETVKSKQLLVPGVPGTEEYNNAFFRRVCHMLDNPDMRHDVAEQAGSEVDKSHNWKTIVGEWDRLFSLALMTTMRNRPGVTRGNSANG